MCQGLCPGVKRRLYFKRDSRQGVKGAKNYRLKLSAISSFSSCCPYFAFKYFDVTVEHTIFQFQYENQQFAK